MITIGDPNPQRAVVLLHGRGSSPEDILALAQHLPSSQTQFLAPRAKDNTWYPRPFLRPTAENEPFLSAALEQVRLAVLETGLEQEKIVLLGFSQGACLALEYAKRCGGRFGGVVAFSGGLIGIDPELGQLAQPLESTPVFLGCDAQDAHIPLERVHTSAHILTTLGAVMDTRIYQGLGHGINQDELRVAQQMLKAVLLESGLPVSSS
jgi:phospholipase/carboxylesterase